MNTFYKVLLVILLLSILGINVLALSTRAVKTTVDTIEETAENIIDNTESGVKDIINIAKPQPDASDKSIFQRRNKKQFCFVGSDRGHRSCIEMDNNDICQSKEVYHHYKKCINPELRL